MKVTDHILTELNQVTAKRTEKAQEAKRGASRGVASKESLSDHVHLSGLKGQMEVFRDHLNRLPDVRAERVQALRERIESGQYRPDAMDIADAIVERTLQSR